MATQGATSGHGWTRANAVAAVEAMEAVVMAGRNELDAGELRRLAREAIDLAHPLPRRKAGAAAEPESPGVTRANEIAVALGITSPTPRAKPHTTGDATLAAALNETDGILAPPLVVGGLPPRPLDWWKLESIAALLRPLIPGGPSVKGEAVARGEDYTWVVWFGERYSFSKGNQAEAVRALWAEWERSGQRDNCGMSEKTIGEKVGTANEDFRLAHVFRDHPALGTMIRPVGKGVFALAGPESPQNPI